MKFTIICHLAAFYLDVVTDKNSGQMINNCDFQTVARYDVSSVVFMCLVC